MSIYKDEERKRKSPPELENGGEPSLDKTEGQYTPGSAVNAAESYLSDVLKNRPGSFEGKYTAQLDALYDRITNEERFSYDADTDPMYRMYERMYREKGENGLRDSMAAANTRTGGYGSSYAVSAGRAAYGSAMNELTQIVPELRAQAMETDAAERSLLRERYGLMSETDTNDYARYRDRVNDWQNERAYAASSYENAYTADYGAWRDRLSMENERAALDRTEARNARDDAMDRALLYIRAGIMPGADMISAAGLDPDNVRALVKKKK